MTKPKWLTVAMVTAMHNEALAIFGGGVGMRDMGLLESALDRPKNLLAYDPEASIFEMASSLCIGICKNYAFVDGNKRTALLSANAFLFLNGWIFDPAQPDEVETMVGVAVGEIQETELAGWFEANSQRT